MMSTASLIDASIVLEEIDRLGDNLDIRYLLKYFKFGNYKISKNILKRLYIIISSVDPNSVIFKTKYEPAFVSHEFIRKLTVHFLCKYSLGHPDILTAKVFMILLHLCQKTDNLTLSTMETTQCLQHIFKIFIEKIKLFKESIYLLEWTGVEREIFYLVWRALPCLFNMVIIDKTDVCEEIPPVCKSIFFQAIKFCKLNVNGDTLSNGWKKELPLGIFDYINCSLKYKQYLEIFYELNAIHIFTKWLKGNSIPEYSGYVINIIHTYVVNFPEESLQANIIPDLLNYMFENQKNVCNGIYQGQKYCELGDICQILKFLIENTKSASISYRFEDTIKLLAVMMNSCDIDCISKVFAYQLIFIIRDIRYRPIFKKQCAINTFDDVMQLAKAVKQLLDIISVIKCRIQNYLHGRNESEEDDDQEEDILPCLSDGESSDSSHSPEYSSSSSGIVEEDREENDQNDEIQTISSPEYDSDSIEMMSWQDSEVDETNRMDLTLTDDETTVFPNGDQSIDLIDSVVASNFWPVKENNPEVDKEFIEDGDDRISSDEDILNYSELEEELIDKIRTINDSIK